MFFRRRSLISFSIILAWLAAFQPWGRFPDPDAFYHAKMASVIATNGVPQAFPWLDLTRLGPDFVDQHYLFHLLLIPFEKVFGMLPGTQIAAVVFAFLFVLTFFFALKKLSVRWPLFWTFLAVVTPGLLMRLSYAKASPLALIWLVIGLVAVALRKPIWAFIAGLGFALSHDGWIVLLACQGLFVIGEFVFDRVIERQPWKRIFSFDRWRSMLSTLGGVALGLFLHPNFPDNLSFLWVQVVKIGLGTPFGRVFLGSEWLPPSFSDVWIGLGALFVIATFLFWLVWHAHRTELDRTLARRVIAFAFPVAALFALMLKSFRALEYFVPVFILWLACLFLLVDGTRVRLLLKRSFSKWFTILCVAMALAPMSVGLVEAWSLMHDAKRTFGEFAKPMAVISSHAQPGDRVFHSNWDQFPQWWVLDDRLRYVVGLDPTFLLDAHPDLSDAYRDLTIGRRTDAYAVIHDQFHAQFVFVELEEHEAFAQAVAGDGRFHLLYEDDKTRVYQLL